MANNRMTLLVNLEFNEHSNFDDQGIKEITEKIAASIKATANEVGLTPDGYETYVKSIDVTENFSNISSVEVL